MITVRVLVGTRKGAFVLAADADRCTWTVDGPVFGGWEVFHVEASPADPDRVYAALWTAWHGAVVQRSDDGGRTWSPVGVLREAMAVDRLDPCGIYVGTTGGQLYASRDAGARWEAVVTHLPPVLSVEVQTLGRAP
jgi:photosystem II stability/assembly factor-like uncharacterized protein